MVRWWGPPRRSAEGGSVGRPATALPIRVGKAQQMLSAAVILGDHELASWVDAAVKRSLVVGAPECLDDLKKRLDRVMAPLPDATPADAATPLPIATTSAA